MHLRKRAGIFAAEASCFLSLLLTILTSTPPWEHETWLWRLGILSQALPSPHPSSLSLSSPCDKTAFCVRGSSRQGSMAQYAREMIKCSLG